MSERDSACEGKLSPAADEGALDPAPSPSAARHGLDQPVSEPLPDDALGRLDLLPPDRLTPEVALAPAEAEILRTILTRFLDCLVLDHGKRVGRIDDLLRDLGKREVLRSQILTDGLPLTPFQVKDYDAYFRVDRVVAAAPAIALVRSLLQAARAASCLFDQTPNLSEARTRQQMDGLSAHAHLLARAFGLEPLP